MKERQVDPETPRVPKRDIYIYIYIYIYIQTYNFETVLRDQMPRAKALGNKLVKKLQRVFSWRFSSCKTQTGVFFDDTHIIQTDTNA